MLDFISSRGTLFFVLAIAVLAVGCSQDKQAQTNSEIPTTASTLSSRAESPAQAGAIQVNPISQSSSTATKPQKQPNLFEQGLDKASGAFSISQTAQSSADWDLVANQYQDAIALMRQVERGNPYFAIAQSKISEYQRQFKVAQVKKIPNSPQQIPQAVEPQRVVVAVPQTTNVPSLVVPTPVTQQKIKLKHREKPLPVPSISPVETEFLTQQLIIEQPSPAFIIPIKRRAGGTPVIDVTFNGNQQFEMIVDTGASGTVITQKMATVLAVVPVGKAKANTASSKAVEFPIGYIDTMEVSGVKANKIAVAIAGAELETGLLGHDFFGNYDITIKRDVVEFRPHSDTPPNFPIRPAVPIYPKQRHSG